MQPLIRKATMITLKNDRLRVRIDPTGAQLTSIFDETTTTEHLWQADPAVWPWHAPNLFPIVGGLNHNQLLIDGRAYPMNRHGFARQSAFTVEEATPMVARLILQDSSATQVGYPYRFELAVIYGLEASTLTVVYRVENRDDKPIYFSVGGHPAFAVPFGPGEDYADYYIEFARDEPLHTQLLSANGLFTGEVQPVPTTGNRLPLTRHLFDRDALVFKDIASRSVSLRSQKHDRAVRIDFADFVYLGLWAKPGADFVCIEPWLGCADSEGDPVPIQGKEAIQQLAVGERFEAEFSITVGQ
jgi:galactose mutarotase-like enzyme